MIGWLHQTRFFRGPDGTTLHHDIERDDLPLLRIPQDLNDRYEAAVSELHLCRYYIEQFVQIQHPTWIAENYPDPEFS